MTNTATTEPVDDVLDVPVSVHAAVDDHLAEKATRNALLDVLALGLFGEGLDQHTPLGVKTLLEVGRSLVEEQADALLKSPRITFALAEV